MFRPQLDTYCDHTDKVSLKGAPKILPPLDNHESQVSENLIRTISSKPVRAVLRPDLPFVIDTYASDSQVGAAYFRSFRTENVSR